MASKCCLPLTSTCPWLHSWQNDKNRRHTVEIMRTPLRYRIFIYLFIFVLPFPSFNINCWVDERSLLVRDDRRKTCSRSSNKSILNQNTYPRPLSLSLSLLYILVPCSAVLFSCVCACVSRSGFLSHLFSTSATARIRTYRHTHKRRKREKKKRTS